MRVVISGGSGFTGEPLVRALQARGDDGAVLTRHPSHVNAGRALVWDPGARDGAWRGEATSADAVVNLAGENVAGRWTAERKRRIVDSRVTATRALIEALESEPGRSRVLVSASAGGFYGNRNDELLDEQAESGSGFLAGVVRRGEKLAHGADHIARVVILRFGVVLAANGGALGKMLLSVRIGVGGASAGWKWWDVLV